MYDFIHRDKRDVLPTKMPELSKGIYFIVQRALKSIWFGDPPSPIREAITHTQMEKGLDVGEYCEAQAKQALAQYVNLIIRKIVGLEDDQTIKDITNWQKERFYAIIAQGTSNIEELHKEERELSNQIHKQTLIVQDLRRRKMYLNGQEKSLAKRIQQLEENEHHVQSELRKVGKLNPVEINQCLAIANILAVEANNLKERERGI